VEDDCCRLRSGAVECGTVKGGAGPKRSGKCIHAASGRLEEDWMLGDGEVESDAEIDEKQQVIMHVLCVRAQSLKKARVVF
jgi:hypothetical protein